MGTGASTQERTRCDNLSRPPQSAEPFEWLNLLDALSEPAALIEKGLGEVDSIRQPSGGRPRKAMVIGTNTLGLLASLKLRGRGDEVVTLGRLPQPLFSPSRLKGLPGWKQVWMSPALVRAQLVEDIGARYVSTSELGSEDAALKLGRFDLIIVGAAESSPRLGVTRGLAENGLLVDFTLGTGIIELWAACCTPGFLVKHQVTLPSRDRIYGERAIRNLALADALYPSWLARVLANDLEAMQDPGHSDTCLES